MNHIEFFKLGRGRPLSADVQEMIAREMKRGIPRDLRPKPWVKPNCDLARIQRAADQLEADVAALIALGDHDLPARDIQKHFNWTRHRTFQILRIVREMPA